MCRLVRPFDEIIAALVIVYLCLTFPVKGLSASEVSHLTKWIASEVALQTESSTSSVSEVFFGVEAASKLGAQATDALPAQKICKKFKSVLPAKVDDAFYVASVLQSLKCEAAEAFGASKDVAEAALREFTSFEEAYFAISTLLAVSKSGVSVTLGAEPVEKLAILTKDLTHSSAALKAVPSARTPSFLATGQAYLAIANARALQAPVGEDAEALIDDVVNNVGKVLDLMKSDGGLYAKLDKDQLEATGRLLEGAAALGVVGSDRKKASQVLEYLHGFRFVGSLADAYNLLSGLRAFVASSLPPAVLVTPLLQHSHLSDKGTVAVVLETPLGGAPPACTVSLASLVSTSGTVALQAQPFHGPAEDGSYTIHLAQHNLPLGVYKATVVVDECTASAASYGETSFNVYVTEKVNVVDMTIMDGFETVAKPQFPDAVRELLELGPTSQLKVTFKLTTDVTQKPYVPQQVLLRVEHKATHKAVFVVAKLKANVWSAHVSSAAIEKQLGTLGGVYAVSLLVADDALYPPVDWEILSGNVLFTPQKDGSQPPPPPPAAREVSFQPQPTIIHMHRPPEQRPAPALSYAFTALTLTPWLVVLLALPSLKANLKGFTAGPATLANAAFHGGILSILLLYTLFWTHINLLQTLPILLGLGLFTSVSGYFALSAHAEARLKLE